MVQPIWQTPAGSITFLIEGNPFNFLLEATNAEYFTLISGSLPTGVNLNITTGLLFGTIPDLDIGKTFYFTIRASNSDGITDRNFNITVVDKPIVWNNPSMLGTFLHKTYLSIKISVLDPGFNNTEFELLSGELPNSLVLYKNGLLSGYIDELSDFEPLSKSYSFTVKTVNGSSYETKAFTLIVTKIGDLIPQWNTIGAYNIGNNLEGGNLGNLVTNVPYSFQLSSSDSIPVGPSAITYSLVSGILPTGMALSTSGLISGIPTDTIIGLYPIIINISDGISNITRIFYFRLNFNNINLIYFLLEKSLLDVGLDTVTTQSQEFIAENDNFSIFKLTSNSTQDLKFFNDITSKLALDIHKYFLLTYTDFSNYSLLSYANSNTIYNNYTLQGLTTQEFKVKLGKVSIGDNVNLKITAISTSDWVRYELVSGTLPAGLYLNISTGNIYGSVNNQLVGDYIFKVKAFNTTNEQMLTFIIEVTENLLFLPNKLSYQLDGQNKLTWLKLFNTNYIKNELIYNSFDDNFGKNTNPSVFIANLKTTTSNDILNLLKYKTATTLEPEYFYNTGIVEKGVKICDVVILKFNDFAKRCYISYNTSDNKGPVQTLEPGGLKAIRQTLIDANLSNSVLPNWMNLEFVTNFKNSEFILKTLYNDLITGDSIVFNSLDLPLPFENDIEYFVIKTSSNSFTLASSYDNSVKGNKIAFNANETTEYSGYFKTYITGIPVVCLKSGFGKDVENILNTQTNILQNGYYSLDSSQFFGTFFAVNIGHNLKTGDPIIFNDNIIPAPLALNTIYYVIKITDFYFSVALTKSNALSNLPIIITDTVNPQTKLPMNGSFKRLSERENINVEVDLKFKLFINSVKLSSAFKQTSFIADGSTNILTINDHNLLTGEVLRFEKQVLSSPLLNDTDYYVNVVNSNSFKLSSTLNNCLANITIDFANNFTGLITINTDNHIFLNLNNKFDIYADSSTNLFTLGNVTTFELTDTIRIVSKFDNILPFTQNQDYFVIPVNNHSFRLANSLLNAQNNIFLPISNNFSAFATTSFFEYNNKRY